MILQFLLIKTFLKFCIVWKMHLLLSAIVMSGFAFLSSPNYKHESSYALYRVGPGWLFCFELQTLHYNFSKRKLSGKIHWKYWENSVLYIFSLNVSLHTYLKSSSTLHNFTRLSTAFVIFISMYTSQVQTKELPYISRYEALIPQRDYV